MLLLDVNILVNAFLEHSDEAIGIRSWLEDQLDGPTGIAVTEAVLVGFVRVVTQVSNAEPASALAFVTALRESPACQVLTSGDRFWALFASAISSSQARGRLISDAALAAIAIESDCELISLDNDFARFPGLRWCKPRS